MNCFSYNQLHCSIIRIVKLTYRLFYLFNNVFLCRQICVCVVTVLFLYDGDADRLFQCLLPLLHVGKPFLLVGISEGFLARSERSIVAERTLSGGTDGIEEILLVGCFLHHIFLRNAGSQSHGFLLILYRIVHGPVGTPACHQSPVVGKHISMSQPALQVG